MIFSVDLDKNLQGLEHDIGMGQSNWKAF